MDENELQQNLDVYRAQLSQVEQQVAAVGETEELRSLVADLKELISLTEGSLLALKKSKLLKTLEDHAESSTPQSSSTQPSAIDDEYALFQASLQEDLAEGEGDSYSISAQTSSATAAGDNVNCAIQPSTSHKASLPFSTDSAQNSDSDSDSDSDTSSDSDHEDSVCRGEKSVDEDLTNLVGMKCCAPFSHDWGKLDYHNALVMSAVRDSQTDKILVKVMFTTPTHIAMKPCKFFLDGHCRFNDDKCKFSHGRTVALDELREFVEADHSTIAVDTKCLAQYTDSIWYRATVTEVKDNMVSVHFDDYGEDLDVDMTQVVPSVSQAEDSSDSEQEELDREDSASTGQGRAAMLDSEEEEEEEELPVFLWRPPQTTAAMGEWETHTRGIGSKLMSKMGYIPGQGLGVNGQGKAEPVPIMLLPQGKSLDRIMELKEMAGNQDLFNAMKKLEKQKQKADKKREKDGKNAAMSAASAAPTNVFDFINTKLAGKKGNLSSLAKLAGSGTSGADKSSGAQSRRHISEHELHKKTDKDINLQVFKTHEEIRGVERQIERLREQLARNENKDRRVAAQVRARLEEQQEYLSKLQSSSVALEKHQKKRSNSKKLTIF